MYVLSSTLVSFPLAFLSFFTSLLPLPPFFFIPFHRFALLFLSFLPGYRSRSRIIDKDNARSLTRSRVSRVEFSPHAMDPRGWRPFIWSRPTLMVARSPFPRDTGPWTARGSKAK